MPPLVVTGAAGFIGSNLAHRLAAGGEELILVDHPLTEPKLANWAGLPRFAFFEHEPFLRELEADRLDVAAVFHLGACSRTTEHRWDYLVRNNIEYSQRLWRWCARRGRPLLYASSAATYGDGSSGFDDRLDPAGLRPLNPYGRSKNDFDHWALDQSKAPPRWAGLKFFNVYGPREGHKGRMSSVVFQSYHQIKASGMMRLFRSNDPDFPDGGQRRDFVAVADCVGHLIHLWQSGAPVGLYNSGTGRARTFLDLTRAVFAALGREPSIAFIDMPPDLTRQYQNHTQAVIEKLAAVGADPPTPLEAGVADYVRWLETPNEIGEP